MMTRTELPDAKCGCPRYLDTFADEAIAPQTACGHTPECKAKTEARARRIRRAERAARAKKRATKTRSSGWR